MKYFVGFRKRFNILWLAAGAAAYLFVFVLSAVPTVQAFTCSGQPDDYYQRDLNSNIPFKSGDITGFSDDFERDLAKQSLHWDEDEKRCKIQTIDSGDTKTADKGVCPSGYISKPSNKDLCYRLIERSTNDKPTYDDGTPITGDDIYCSSVQDNYDQESFTCKESGSCNWVGTCDYNQVDFSQDAKDKDAEIAAKVKQCKDAGATFDTNTKKCNWTYDTCKKAGGTFNDTTKECKEASPDDGETCNDGSTPDKDGNCAGGGKVGDPSGNLGTDTVNCGQANTVLISCDSGTADCSGSSNNSGDGEKGTKDGAPVIACVLRIGIQALTALIGIGAVGGIAWEALKYAKAGDNQSDTSEAKTRITEIVIGLVIYSFMLVAANWLIPGGII